MCINKELWTCIHLEQITYKHDDFAEVGEKRGIYKNMNIWKLTLIEMASCSPLLLALWGDTTDISDLLQRIYKTTWNIKESYLA